MVPVKTQHLELSKETTFYTSIGVVILSTVNFLNSQDIAKVL
jgi:hypothetical protein